MGEASSHTNRGMTRTDAVRQSKMVCTGRRSRVLWMTWFRGYRVDHVIRVPRYVFLGQVAYTNTWWLRKISGEEEGRDEA